MLNAIIINKKSLVLKHTLLYSAIAVLGVHSTLANAQSASSTDSDVEEVVVTGTYIRNSAFAGASPVDTIDQEA